MVQIDDIKREIQKFFDQGTVTVVGSGLSCAEGISGMSGLSDELIKNVPNMISIENQKYWEKIAEGLNNGLDLESVLQKNVVTDEIEKAVVSGVYNLISNETLNIFTQIVEDGRRLKFSDYLGCFNMDLYNLVVITTNYDLLIEYACEIAGVEYTDSYHGKIISKFSPEMAEREMIKGVRRGKPAINEYKKHVKLYKPHGSINWKILKGNLYRINNHNCGIPCIITPGSKKYEKGYEVPFDYHISKMGQEIDGAKRLIFIGYGFNDSHLETHLIKTNNSSKPQLILTRTLSDKAKQIAKNNSNVIAIESNGSNGSKIYIEQKCHEVQDKMLWDISKLIKEVF